MAHFVIVGNGVAGTEAAQAIRAADSEVEITILSASSHQFYARPRLPEYLVGSLSLERLTLGKSELLAKQNIQLRLATKVVSIDSQEKKLNLESGEVISYDRLLLASGASAFIPPGTDLSLPGVFKFRGINDAEDMRQWSANSRRCIVCGGGLLGLETAHALTGLGLEVTVVELFDRLLPRQLDHEAAQILQKLLKKTGIHVCLGAKISEIQGEEKIIGCVLDNGQHLETDMLVLNIGIRPELELAKTANLKTARGVLVDDNLRTSDSNIFAAGDCAEHREVCYGLWAPAKEQGIIAGKNMVGVDEKYCGTPLETRLKVAGISVFSAGDFQLPSDEQRVLQHDEVFCKACIKDGELIAGIVVGDPKATKIMAMVFEKKAELSKLDEIFGN